MCQREFLKKDEDKGWDLYKALAEKTIQWESCLEKINLTTFRTGMHSTEPLIAAETKITQLIRRLELLEIGAKLSKPAQPNPNDKSGLHLLPSLDPPIRGVSSISSPTDVL